MGPPGELGEGVVILFLGGGDGFGGSARVWGGVSGGCGGGLGVTSCVPPRPLLTPCPTQSPRGGFGALGAAVAERDPSPALRLQSTLGEWGRGRPPPPQHGDPPPVLPVTHLSVTCPQELLPHLDTNSGAGGEQRRDPPQGLGTPPQFVPPPLNPPSRVPPQSSGASSRPLTGTGCARWVRGGLGGVPVGLGAMPGPP